MRFGVLEKFRGAEFLVGGNTLAEPLPVLDQRPVFMGLWFAAHVGKATGPCDETEKAELEGEAFPNRSAGRRLARLVIDDREAARRSHIDPVGFSVDDDAGDLSLAANLRPKRQPALLAVLDLLLADPFGRFTQ